MDAVKVAKTERREKPCKKRLKENSSLNKKVKTMDRSSGCWVMAESSASVQMEKRELVQLEAQ